jgi:pilus assembly protein CpaB
MPRYRPYLVLAAGGLMALVTSLLVFNWLSRLERPQQREAPNTHVTMVAVAVASEPWGTTLSKEMLRLVPYPKGSLPQGHFADIERLKGRVLITNVSALEPILETKLAPISVTTGGVAAVTDPQKRAMAVKVDDVVGVAGFINPGNRVDVLVALRHDPPITKIVLQNVLVLATGAELERTGREQKPLPVKVITMEVTPQEAEKLALASTNGKIRLALRNQLGSQPVLTKGETIASLLASYSPEEPQESEATPAGKPINLKKHSQARMEVVQGNRVVRYEIVDGQLKRSLSATRSIVIGQTMFEPRNLTRQKRRLASVPAPRRQIDKRSVVSELTPRPRLEKQSAVPAPPPRRQTQKAPTDKRASKAFPYQPLKLISQTAPALPEPLSPEAVQQYATLQTWLENAPARYGPIQNGNTLYGIVTELGVPRDVIWQAIVHLWQTNQQHFTRGQLRALHTGIYLTISRQVAQEVVTMSEHDALRIVAGRSSRN